MSDVVNRATGEYRRSVNTPDYDEIDWLINPDVSAVAGVRAQYWKVVGDDVVPMTADEMAAVDAAAIVARDAFVPQTFQLRSPGNILFNVSISDIGDLTTVRA